MVLFDFGRFQRRYAPKTHLVSRFLGWYGTLCKECTRTTNTTIQTRHKLHELSHILRLGGGGESVLLYFSFKCATRQLVPTRSPVLFLTRGAAVPGGLALRAHFEVHQTAHNLAPVVEAILRLSMKALDSVS